MQNLYKRGVFVVGFGWCGTILFTACGSGPASNLVDAALVDAPVRDATRNDADRPPNVDPPDVGARDANAPDVQMDTQVLDAAENDAPIDAARRIDGGVDAGADATAADASVRDTRVNEAAVRDPDGYAWRRVETSGPSARSATGAMVYDSARQRIVLFGGRAAASNEGDTWEWDGSNWTRRETTVSPPGGARRLAFDRARNVAVLFGGTSTMNGQDIVMNDTWEWDGNTWTPKTPPTAPPARVNHSLVYDAARARVVLFGGYAGTAYAREDEYLADTWEWDGGNWTRASTSIAPPARSAHGTFYDASAQRAILFGGDTSWRNSIMIAVHVRNDTWSWNGAAWAQIVDAGAPPVRRMAGFAFDTQRNLGFVFGGEDIAGFDNVAPTTLLGDMWRFQDGRWTEIAFENGPSARSRVALAYDEARQELVLFGGMTALDYSRNGETWVYGRNR